MSREVLESDIHSVCVLACCSIKTHTSSEKELFPPHPVSAMQLAPPESSAEPPPTQRIVTHHLPAHPSTKLLKPLYQSLKAWEVIPGISRWLLRVIKRGYTLQFRRRPPRFKGVVQSLTLPRNAQVLREEVRNLLKKGAIEKVPPSEQESGFYSRYFVMPKRDGGLHPILDLRLINRALGKRPFRISIRLLAPSRMLSFLQYRLDSGSLPSTLKVYVAAIASFRSPQGGQSIGYELFHSHHLSL